MSAIKFYSVKKISNLKGLHTLMDHLPLSRRSHNRIQRTQDHVPYFADRVGPHHCLSYLRHNPVCDDACAHLPQLAQWYSYDPD